MERGIAFARPYGKGRGEAARKHIETVEWKAHGFWYAFGVRLTTPPLGRGRHVSMAAVAMRLAVGALSRFETPPLLTVEETFTQVCASRARRRLSTARPNASPLGSTIRHRWPQCSRAGTGYGWDNLEEMPQDLALHGQVLGLTDAARIRRPCQYRGIRRWNAMQASEQGPHKRVCAQDETPFGGAKKQFNCSWVG